MMMMMVMVMVVMMTIILTIVSPAAGVGSARRACAHTGSYPRDRGGAARRKLGPENGSPQPVLHRIACYRLVLAKRGAEARAARSACIPRVRIARSATEQRLAG
jgi:hypothetical protein